MHTRESRYNLDPQVLMNDAKYIGRDVHQATISVAAARESGDGGHSGNETVQPSPDCGGRRSPRTMHGFYGAAIVIKPICQLEYRSKFLCRACRLKSAFAMISRSWFGSGSWTRSWIRENIAVSASWIRRRSFTGSCSTSAWA